MLFLASHKDVTKRKISGEVPEQDVGMLSIKFAINIFNLFISSLWLGETQDY